MADDLAHLRALETSAEAAYDAMYEAHNRTDATMYYSDAKETFCDAIALAERLALKGTAARLEARLAHIKAVFRSQFT